MLALLLPNDLQLVVAVFETMVYWDTEIHRFKRLLAVLVDRLPLSVDKGDKLFCN